MYSLTFKNVGEIRMGSPFNMAEVVLTGGYLPDFSQFTFQDLGIVDLTGNAVYLVQWEVERNQPGFRIWRVSSPEQNVYRTRRLEGCCKKITLIDDKLNLEILRNEQTDITIVNTSDFKFFD